jgi:predicted nucleic acid-binding protein
MEIKQPYLLDTCILIDYLRGNDSIYDLLVNNDQINLAMSTITMMELVIGALNKREVQYIQKAFNEITVINITTEISILAQSLLIQYSKSHNLRINDALIAATAIETEKQLITYNITDFQFIPNILLYKF